MHPEYQYLDLVKNVIDTGEPINGRNGKVLTKFGAMMRFDLRNESFPLLTTKRVYWKGVVEELMWFLRGDTNANHLRDKNVNIWNDNGTKEFLESRGITDREEGDLGPIYGFQWRHFGAKYTNMNADYSGQGYDQVTRAIELIRNDPTNRRIIISAWNPPDLEKMALPPCHVLSQYHVSNGELSCMMYQRSCDLGLGVPFNIASYSLLTCILAHVCSLSPGEFVYSMGNIHVYNDHIPALQQQIKREPRPFPRLRVSGPTSSIEQTKFQLSGYNPHPTLPMKMIP
jgi:thymidylate synthase